MDTYLHFRVGPYDLLLHAASVAEILDEGETPDDLRYRLWRRLPLLLVSARSLLGLPEAPQACVLVHQCDPDETPRGIRVDTLVGLTRLDEAGFRPIPPLTDDLCRLFDAARPQGDGRTLLRCRPGWADSLPQAEGELAC